MIISLLMSIKRILLSFGIAYLAIGLAAVSLVTVSYASNGSSAVDKFISKGESLGFQCQKGQSQPFADFDLVGDYAYCAPLSDQFSIYYVPGKNAKNDYMALQESRLQEIPGVSSILRRGKYYLVIMGSPNVFQDTVSLQQLLRPTDLITYDPEKVARSAQTLAIPIYSQSNDLKIAWNTVLDNPNCSLNSRCVNLSVKVASKSMSDDSCLASLDIAWLTKDTETIRLEKIFFTMRDKQSLSKNIYARNATERYVKVISFGCQN